MSGICLEFFLVFWNLSCPEFVQFYLSRICPEFFHVQNMSGKNFWNFSCPEFVQFICPEFVQIFCMSGICPENFSGIFFMSRICPVFWIWKNSGQRFWSFFRIFSGHFPDMKNKFRTISLTFSGHFFFIGLPPLFLLPQLFLQLFLVLLLLHRKLQQLLHHPILSLKIGPLQSMCTTFSIISLAYFINFTLNPVLFTILF